MNDNYCQSTNGIFFTMLGSVTVGTEGWYQLVPIMVITWVLIVDVLLVRLLPAFCNMFLLVSSIK